MPASLSERHRWEILAENSSMEVHAKGVSLWLMPEGDARKRLSGLIDSLALRLDTEGFAPHVTLLPGLGGPQSRVVDDARLLAGRLQPCSLGFTVVDGEEQYFRCLFLRVGDDPGLHDAHALAARQFGRQPDPGFCPHLSLVYGALGARRKAGLVSELSGETATSFDAGRLHVWKTEGPVGDWRELAAFDLTAG